MVVIMNNNINMNFAKSITIVVASKKIKMALVVADGN